LLFSPNFQDFMWWSKQIGINSSNDYDIILFFKDRKYMFS